MEHDKPNEYSVFLYFGNKTSVNISCSGLMSHRSLIS